MVLTIIGRLASCQIRQTTIENRTVSGWAMQVPSNIQLKSLVSYDSQNNNVQMLQKPRQIKGI
jgi:hypothetical protein